MKIILISKIGLVIHVFLVPFIVFFVVKKSHHKEHEEEYNGHKERTL
jgi:hypothetical protein